jgi:hypothetical protein
MAAGLAQFLRRCSWPRCGKRANHRRKPILEGKPPLEARKRIEDLLKDVRESAALPENLRKLRGGSA